MAKESVPQQLVNEDSDYKDDEPLLRQTRKRVGPKTPPPPNPFEVEDTGDTEVTTSSEQASEEQESEHTKQKSEGTE